MRPDDQDLVLLWDMRQEKLWRVATVRIPELIAVLTPLSALATRYRLRALLHAYRDNP